MNNPVNVLIVDDSPDDAELLGMELSSNGLHAHWRRVDDEPGLLAAYREEPWDVVLCDIRMPHLSTERVLEITRETDPDTPVIIISGTVNEADAINFFKAGARDFLSKDNLARLPMAIRREMVEHDSRQARRQAEEQLRHRESHLRSLLNAMAEGVYVVDMDGLCTTVNPACIQLLGYDSADDLIGQQMHELVHHTHSDGRASPRETCPIHNVIETGTPFKESDQFLWRRDGSGFPASIQAVALKDGDVVTGAVITFWDISEERAAAQALQASEERYKLAENAVNDGVWDWNILENTVYYSPRWKEILGFRDDELPNTESSFFDLVHPEDKTAVNLAIENHLEKNERYALEFRLRHKDGSYRWILSRGEAVRNEDGQPIRMIGSISDITERKRMYDALSESETRLRSILDYAPALISTKDLEGTITLVNPRFSVLAGPSPEDFIGKNVYDLFPHDIADALWKNDLAAREGPVEVEEVVGHKDGTLHTYLTTKFPLTDESGALFGTCAISTDITDRKEMEAALRKSEDQFRSLVESTSDWIWELDTEANFNYVSPRVKEILGYEPEEIVGKLTGFDLMPGEEAEKIRQKYIEFVAAAKPFNNMVNVNLHKDGRQVIMESSGRPFFNESGKLLGFRGIDRDITERIHAEEALKERLKELACLYAVNRYMQEDLSIDDFCSLTVKRTVSAMQHPELAVPIIELHDRQITTDKYSEKLFHNLQQTIRVKGEAIGSFRIYYSEEKPFLIPEAQNLVNAIAETIGRWLERKEAETELIETRDAANKANRVKSIFLATMSHEIRTPMNAILGMAELLTETRLSETQAWYVNTINRSAETLLALINDILDLSKVEAGQLTLEETSLSPELLIDNILDLFSLTAMEKGITLTSSIDKGVPEKLLGDPTRLRQVLQNLVGNAIKFTNQGEVRVTVTSDANHLVTFTVIDNGIGIPKARQGDIFQPFTQADSSTTRKHGGTGLGLAICRRLAELMKGQITLKSQPGEGSTFTLTVPLKLAPKEDSSAKKKRKTKKTKKTKRLLSPETTFSEVGLKILLVDDAEDNRLLIQAFMKKTPHHLTMAENGEEAVSLFKDGLFDIVLMDIQMPVMDGYEATQNIRAWEKENNRLPTPILALTAHVMMEEAEKIKAAGCDLHLAKPIRKQRLIEAINTFRPDSGESS
ncbi:MAG: PAS domain S-box protein [Magnetococcales bacterium]|nr:PAS domain S-box protein [Magnetococcales bacterium]